MPVTKDTDDLIETFVAKSVMIFEKKKLLSLASDLSKQTLKRMNTQVTVEHQSNYVNKIQREFSKSDMTHFHPYMDTP